MKKINSYDAFVMGFGLGIAFLAVILFLTEKAPNTLIRKYESQIIERGYGEYYIDDNVTIKFRWLDSEGTEL